MRIHRFYKILGYLVLSHFCFGTLAISYSCNDLWCNDYKVGIGGYVAHHSTAQSNPNITQGGAYLAVRFRRWKEWFSFGVDMDFGLGGAGIKSNLAQSVMPNLANNSANVNISATVHTGINAYQLEKPIFIDIFTSFRANLYEVESNLPYTTLLSLGTSLLSMRHLNDIIGLEYGISYGYIVYGSHIFREFSSNRPNPHFPTRVHKTNDTTSRINQNSHEAKAFIGLFGNNLNIKKQSWYGRLSVIYHYVDSSRKVAFGGASDVYYPRTQNISTMLEIGLGF
ncbi:hypothetical protein [Helicobacter sp. T3_23-1056]